MAGKSNKGRNKRGSNSATNSSDPVGSADSQMKDTVTASGPNQAEANGVVAVGESNCTNSEVKESETANSKDGPKQGELVSHLVYHIEVLTSRHLSASDAEKLDK